MGERGIVSSPEAIKTERLSDEEMGNLLSALGNHEAKALTLCLMTPGVIYSRSDFHRAVIQAQGLKMGWRMASSTLFAYCSESLSPIGLVTREVINPDLSTYGYMKTERGERIGVPLAGLLTDFSLHHPDFSLQDFFGSTHSPSKVKEIGEIEFKKRSPTTRLKIFRELLSSNFPHRAVDIANQIGQPKDSGGIIGSHLSQLAERGIVSYEVVKAGEEWVFYRLSETPPSSEPEPYMTNRALTSFVYQLLQKDGNREWSAGAIAQRYQQYLEAQSKPLPRNKVSLKNRISQVLSHLAQNSYARRRKFIGGKIYSEVNLTEEQREILSELITLIDRFQNQAPAVLEVGRRLANRIIADSKKVSLLLAKAKEHSSMAGALPKQETADEILRIISFRPDCTSDQIREILKGEGRRLSKISIWDIIKALVAGRKITQTARRGVRYFNLANQPQ